MELADAIVVHKADGDNVRLAKKTVSEYKQILHFLQPATPVGCLQRCLLVRGKNEGSTKFGIQ